ncbi:MAG: hypothetical protein R2749_32090 [Acidimicrobiales bacterium]
MELSSPTLAIGLIRTLNQVQAEHEGLGPEIDRLVQALHTAKQRHPVRPTATGPVAAGVADLAAAAVGATTTRPDAGVAHAMVAKRARRRSFLAAARRPLVQATNLDGRR